MPINHWELGQSLMVCHDKKWIPFERIWLIIVSRQQYVRMQCNHLFPKKYGITQPWSGALGFLFKVKNFMRVTYHSPKEGA